MFKSIFSMTLYNFFEQMAVRSQVWWKYLAREETAGNETDKWGTHCYLSRQVFGQEMGVKLDFFRRKKKLFSSFLQ